MQARRVLLIAFAVVSALAVLDFFVPDSGTFGGIFDDSFVRFDHRGEWATPPDHEERRALEALAVAQGERIAVAETVGDLRVIESESDEATASYTVRVWGTGDAASFARNVTLSWVRNEGEALLVLESPDVLPRGVRAYQVDVELAVPKGTDLSINHRGNLHVEGLSGALDLQHFGGRAMVRNVQGEVAATSRYGTIEVSETGGPVTVRHEGGQAIIRDAGGPVSGVMRFGVINVERAAGFVELDVSMGEGTVNDLRSGADLRVQLGDLTVRLAPDGGWNVKAVVDMGELAADANLRSAQVGTRTEMTGVIGDGRDPLAINVIQGEARLIQTR